MNRFFFKFVAELTTRVVPLLVRPARGNRRGREIHHPPRGRTPCVQETRIKVRDRHLPPVSETSRDDGAPPNRRGKPNKKLLKPNNSHRKSLLKMKRPPEGIGKNNRRIRSRVSRDREEQKRRSNGILEKKLQE
ncbi:hypothetical protein YC2023_065251 [Brassica napus]